MAFSLYHFWKEIKVKLRAPRKMRRKPKEKPKKSKGAWLYF